MLKRHTLENLLTYCKFLLNARDLSSNQKFSRLEANLEQLCAFKKPKQLQQKVCDNLEMQVLLSVQETPRISTSQVAQN